jgi:hypothetical protein
VFEHLLGAAQETRVPQLVDLVGADRALAEMSDEPVQVGVGGTVRNIRSTSLTGMAVDSR